MKPVTMRPPTKNMMIQRVLRKRPFGFEKNLNREMIFRPKCATKKSIKPRPTK